MTICPPQKSLDIHTFLDFKTLNKETLKKAFDSKSVSFWQMPEFHDTVSHRQIIKSLKDTLISVFFCFHKPN